jgi:hypothetical protein
MGYAVDLTSKGGIFGETQQRIGEYDTPLEAEICADVTLKNLGRQFVPVPKHALIYKYELKAWVCGNSKLSIHIC